MCSVFLPDSLTLLFKFCHVIYNSKGSKREDLNLRITQAKAQILFDRSTCFKISWSSALKLSV